MSDRMYKAEDGTALRFYWATEKNEFQSNKHGRPLYDKILYVEVIVPGSSAQVFTPVVLREFCAESEMQPQRNETMFERYKRQIDAFLGDTESPDLVGTPIENWPALDIAAAASLRELKIFTVEGLASLSDEKLRVVGPGGRDLREKAQVFLEAAKGNAINDQILQENSQLREQVSALTEQMAEMDRKMGELARASEPRPSQSVKRTV